MDGCKRMDVNQSKGDLPENQPIRVLKSYFSSHIKKRISTSPKDYLLSNF